MSAFPLSKGLPEILSDTVVYGLVKQVLAMTKVKSVSQTNTQDVVTFVVADSVYTFVVRGSSLINVQSPAPASGKEETQKALSIMLIMWLWNMLARKDRGGFMEILLTVGASSLVSNWLVDPVLGPHLGM